MTVTLRLAGSILLLSLLAVAACPAVAEAEDARPNIVLIVADDLGWADLGCYGSKFHKTPNLDRLAGEARRFTQAYAASPVCSPTRASLMTGKHPSRLGLTDYLPGAGNKPSHRKLVPQLPPGLPLEEVTLAERFKEAGYSTGIIGKWHLGGEGFEPTKQGFEINIAGDETGTPRSYVAPFAKGGRSMPGLEDAPDGQYLTDRLGIEAEKFLEAHKAGPFFLYLPHYAVHIPMVAPADRIAHYPKWDGIPHGRQENPIYAAMLESLDDAVGRVMKALERLGIAENTILIFTSDNGGLATREGPSTPPTVNSPLREGKGWLYEGGIRVPLLIRFPGKISPGVEETPAWAADLVPTLLDLCGLPDPGPLDGVSLAKLLTGGKLLPIRSLYWHYPHYSNQGGRPAGAIRDGNWKLVRWEENGRLELFDLEKDPRESTNLADKNPEKMAELASKLLMWLASVGSRPARNNPQYIPLSQTDDGSVVLRASSAEVHGVMLRFEPLPHKDTLGYWIRPDDWASWDFLVRTPGKFDIKALVGCGKGSGGSVVEFRVAEFRRNLQAFRFTVPETGGFQDFKEQSVGRMAFDRPGYYRIEVRVLSKPGSAVMDLRQVTLTPTKE